MDLEVLIRKTTVNTMFYYDIRTVHMKKILLHLYTEAGILFIINQCKNGGSPNQEYIYNDDDGTFLSCINSLHHYVLRRDDADIIRLDFT